MTSRTEVAMELLRHGGKMVEKVFKRFHRIITFNEI